MTAIWPGSAPLAAWDGLDPRAVAGWKQYAATGAAEADGAVFAERLHRPGWVHTYPPQVLTGEAVAAAETLALRLAELITGFPDRAFGGDRSAWLAHLRLPYADAELIDEALDHPHLAKVATAFMRPDLVVTENGLELVELNVAVSLGGLSTCAPYAAAAADSGFARHLAAQGLRLHGADTSRIWLEVFGSLLRTTDDGPLHVFEAAADPADPAGGRRFFADMIRSAGYRISSGLVHDLELSDEGVGFGGERVHAVFTGYTWDETRRFVPPALTRRLMELDAAGKVDFIGSPAAALHDNKANLALLFDHRFTGLLTAEERELVRAHVPETRVLDASTLEWAMDERARLVCKPAAAYGGKDIAFGLVHSDAAWAEELHRRLDAPGECHVLQRRVPPARLTLPGTATAERELVLAPLLFGGRPAGIFVRHAPPRPDSTVNASSGAEAAGALTLRRTTPLG
ncbi:hypothetical protein ACIA8O_04785 [Kitasatospora sp. NPDC051853]|uniref:hypothetical protein n=1 Tax=Kitasatospora sp. NPDC051853 TaxID=3364058 RepID=UPI0037B8DD4D